MHLNFDFFSIEPSTVIGVLLNTLILFLIFKRFLFAPVNKIIEERKAQVSKTYEDADAALEKAKSMENEYAEKLSLAKEESAEIVRNATKKAQTRSDEIIGEAKNEASNIIVRANAEIEKEKKRAVNQIKDEISDIAVSIAEKVVEKEIDPKTHERLIEDFISNISE